MLFASVAASFIDNPFLLADFHFPRILIVGEGFLFARS